MSSEPLPDAPESPVAVPAPAAEPAPAAPAAKPVKQENAIANLLLNVLLPVTVLSMCSDAKKWYGLGPQWALIVSVSLPIGYFIYDYIQRRKINSLSIIGIVSVTLTGGLGLMNLTAKVFAWKEASVPLVLAAVIYFTGRGKKSLVRQLLLNPDIMDVKKLEKAIDEHQSHAAFDRLMHSSTLLLVASMLLSAVLNYVLAIYFLEGTVPGSQEYTEAIGKQHGWGWLIIGVPSIAMMLFAMMRLFKGLKTLTGLTTDDLMLPR